MKKNVMILGTNGMLGSMLVRRWSDAGLFNLYAGVRSAVSPCLEPSIKEVFTGLDAAVFDPGTQDRLADFIKRQGVEVVVNCIGVIKQRAGGQDPVVTTAVNALFPHQIAQICSSAQARMLHVSTDCVFSGARGGYVESDITDAQDFYGRSKALGEVGEPHLTLRTSIIGPELADGEGLGLLAWLLRQKGPSVPGYSRAIFSGVTTLTLAELMARIIHEHPAMSGLFHVASEPIDKCTLLGKINQAFGLGLEIVPDPALAIDRSLAAGQIKACMAYTAPAWDDQLSALFEHIKKYS